MPRDGERLLLLLLLLHGRVEPTGQFRWRLAVFATTAGTQAMVDQLSATTEPPCCVQFCCEEHTTHETNNTSKSAAGYIPSFLRV